MQVRPCAGCILCTWTRARLTAGHANLRAYTPRGRGSTRHGAATMRCGVTACGRGGAVALGTPRETWHGRDATWRCGHDEMRSDCLRKGRNGGTGYAARDMARQVKWADPALRRERERERERKREHARVGDARTRKERERKIAQARARTRGENTREREREK